MRLGALVAIGMATAEPSDNSVVTEGSDDSVVTEEDTVVAEVDTVVTEVDSVVAEVVRVVVPLDPVVTGGDPAVSNENFVATRERWSLNSITYSSEESVRKNSPGSELMFKASTPGFADEFEDSEWEGPEQSPTTRRKKKFVASLKRARIKRAARRKEQGYQTLKEAVRGEAIAARLKWRIPREEAEPRAATEAEATAAAEKEVKEAAVAA